MSIYCSVWLKKLIFFVFEDIDWKLGTLMNYSFLINIVKNKFSYSFNTVI